MFQTDDFFPIQLQLLTLATRSGGGSTVSGSVSATTSQEAFSVGLDDFEIDLPPFPVDQEVENSGRLSKAEGLRQHSGNFLSGLAPDRRLEQNQDSFPGAVPADDRPAQRLEIPCFWPVSKKARAYWRRPWHHRSSFTFSDISRIPPLLILGLDRFFKVAPPVLFSPARSIPAGGWHSVGSSSQ